jgi:hypothetical protein
MNDYLLKLRAALVKLLNKKSNERKKQVNDKIKKLESI